MARGPKRAPVRLLDIIEQGQILMRIDVGKSMTLTLIQIEYETEYTQVFGFLRKMWRTEGNRLKKMMRFWSIDIDEGNPSWKAITII